MSTKKCIVYGLLMSFMVVAVVFADDADEPTKTVLKEKPLQLKKIPRRPVLPEGFERSDETDGGLKRRGPWETSAAKGRDMASDPMERYKQVLEKRQQIHLQEIQQLEAIKEIASGEEAKKTVEALQKLIDEKNAAFKEATKRSEQQRLDLQKRTKGRLEARKKMYEERMKKREELEKQAKEKATKKAAEKEVIKAEEKAVEVLDK